MEEDRVAVFHTHTDILGLNDATVLSYPAKVQDYIYRMFAHKRKP